MTLAAVAGYTTEEYQALEDRLVQSARDLIPDLIEAAAEAEQLTHIPPHIEAKLEAAELYRMFIPRAHGGLEVQPHTFAKVVIEIAKGDMGMAWNFCLAANHALMLSNWFPVEVHEELYAGGKFKAASMYAPTVKAVKVDGGYEITGVVNYCSGIPYSTHFIGQTLLEGQNPDGSPRVGLYIAPAGSYEILDDWGTTLGLNSSGSNSIKFEQAFLPERFMVEGADLTFYSFAETKSPGEIAYGNPMYNARHMSSFAMMLGMICIGAAYGAVNEYGRLMETRKITIPPFTSRVTDPDFQRWYGGALTNVRKGEFAILQAWAEWERLASTPNGQGGNSFTVEADVLLGNVGREIMLDMWDVVQELYKTIGAAASKKGERFERIFRDMAQAAGHRNPQLRDFAYRLAAQNVFGVNPNA
ncbi:MAG TPA: acyl-CoA dehydrogenase family protein [Microbacteriaceae bacterium]|nr:acyl-CoA dehydrogenase family protein [Microbacteriaceae bacterium]